MAQPARISHRLRGIALAAAGIALIGACAHRAPLHELMQIPIERLRPDDRLRQDTVLVGMLAEIQKMPPDCTIETIYRVPKAEYPKSGSDSRGWFCQGVGAVVYPFWPVVILVALPVVLVSELAKSSDSPAGVSAEPAVDAAVLAREKELQILLQERAQWLTTIALEGQFPATWDDAYISALRQELHRNRPPVERPAAQQQVPSAGRSRFATAQDYFGAGISRMVLVGSKSGEQTLIVCARSFLQSEVARARDFETCQSGPIDLADRQDGGQRLRAVLVEKGRQLALLQAKAMHGKATVELVHANVAGGDAFPKIGTVGESEASPVGTLFVSLNSIEPAGRTDFWALLVVNLGNQSDTGAMFQWIDVQVACVPGQVRFYRQRSYAEWYGEGNLLATATATMEIAPSTLLDASVRLICDAGPKLRRR